MLLAYYRLNDISTLTGSLFGLDHSNVPRSVCYLSPRQVKECVPLPKRIHVRTRMASTIEEVEGHFSGFKTVNKALVKARVLVNIQ